MPHQHGRTLGKRTVAAVAINAGPQEGAATEELVTVGNGLYLFGRIGGNGVSFLVDTGSGVSILAARTWKKKDGTTRFCIDYRRLNQATKVDAYALPHIEDSLNTLGGARFFCSLDLASGYWQVEMDAADREKTAGMDPRHNAGTNAGNEAAVPVVRPGTHHQGVG